MKKRIGVMVLTAVLMSASVLTGCSEISEDTGGNYLFAVGEEKCTVKEALVYLVNMRGIYMDDMGTDLWSWITASGDAAEEQLENLVISRLLYIYCMDQMAEAEGIVLTEEEERVIAEAAEAYMETLTEADLEYLDSDADDIAAYYAHFALAEKYYEEKTADVILSEAASSDAQEEEMLEAAKAEVIQEEYETFIVNVEIAVDAGALSAYMQDESADAQVSTNQFFSVYNAYMSE